MKFKIDTNILFFLLENILVPYPEDIKIFTIRNGVREDNVFSRVILSVCLFTSIGKRTIGIRLKSLLSVVNVLRTARSYWYFYCPPTKLRESDVFTGVFLSTGGGGRADPL